MALLQDLLPRRKRGNCFIQLLALVFIFTATQSYAQHVGTVIGCLQCPEEQYFNIDTQSCEQCTRCLDPLVELMPCAYEVPDYCDILGQFDRLCCHDYEYEAYGECVLDCRRCEVTGRCKQGLLECDCPPDRYGNLCQFTIVPSTSTAILEANPTIEVTATSALLAAIKTTHNIVPPTPTPLLNNVDSE